MLPLGMRNGLELVYASHARISGGMPPGKGEAMQLKMVLMVSAMIAGGPKSPSRFLIVGSIAARGDGYRAIYERAMLDGRPVLAACEQSPAMIAAARKSAADRGWHFCVVTVEDGFRSGIHELVVKSGRLVFRERSVSQSDSSPQLPVQFQGGQAGSVSNGAACDLQGGCPICPLRK